MKRRPRSRFSVAIVCCVLGLPTGLMRRDSCVWGISILNPFWDAFDLCCLLVWLDFVGVFEIINFLRLWSLVQVNFDSP